MFADPCTSCGAHSFIPTERQSNRTTRVATLLKGNNAPHDAEKAQLRTFLDGAQRDLAKYDEKMELLLKERDKLHSHIEDARTLLHPIRMLSDDILLEIFALCIPEWRALENELLDDPDSKYSSLNSKNVPWTLSHVCSWWRRVALSFPRLWSTIIFTFPAVAAKKKAGSRKLDRLNRFCYNFGLFMSRSGNTDLSVAITISDEEIVSDMICVSLSVGATRWRRFHCRGDGIEFPSALSGLYFERLEEILLSSMEETRAMDGTLLDPFRTAPQLKRMRLTDEDGFMALPWSRITHYECDMYYLEEGTLRAMPNLTHLSLNVDGASAQVDKRLSKKFSFPRLLSLSLTLHSYAFFSALLPHLEVPALTDLRLTYQAGNSWNRHFISLPVTDIFPKRLTSLHIACDVSKFRDTDLDILKSWLQLATDITALSIHLPNIPDALLHNLRVQAKGDVLVPRLRSLDLWATAKNARMSTSRVLSVLESRSGSKQNVSRLEEFCTNVDAGRFSDGRLERWQDVCRKVKVFCPR